MTQQDEAREYFICEANPLYFIWNHVQIFDPQHTPIRWFPFKFWPAQERVLRQLHAKKNLIVLKARQLGLTWLCLAYALWLMVCRSGSQILIYSRTDTEAVDLLARIKKMYERLPRYLQANVIETDNDHEFELSNGSKARSFTTTKNSGRGFTASFLLIDEADFIHFLRELLNATLPTIEHGGQGVIISTSDKEQPESKFKELWREANAGNSQLFNGVFLPWSARPERTEQWYEEKRTAVKTESQLDDLHQEYPATPTEALSGRRASKRFPAQWLDQCYAESTAVAPTPLTLPGLTVYKMPEPNVRYIISADTSEGDTSSDPCCSIVWDADTWEEVACLYGLFQPHTHASYTHELSLFYSNAVICPERNNHGHAFIVTLNELQANVYINPFDNKLGWLSSPKYKVQAMNKAAAVFEANDVILHTEATILELANIEASTLSAPSGTHDDRAMTAVIGIAALYWPSLKQETETPQSFSLYGATT